MLETVFVCHNGVRLLLLASKGACCSVLMVQGFLFGGVLCVSDKTGEDLVLNVREAANNNQREYMLHRLVNTHTEKDFSLI